MKHSESDRTMSPGKLGTSGVSFEDEGLDLSQRLAESMFAGPDLDASARDVAVESGTRLQQAVRQLVEIVQVNDQVCYFCGILRSWNIHLICFV